MAENKYINKLGIQWKGLIIDMLLKDKKVCANCANEYQENKNLGYDHYESHRCKENNGKECSDVYNTTCYKFIKKNTD